MKKVCIVTCYKTSNYGSRLQALALSMAIKKTGYTPYFLKSFKDYPFMLRHPRMIYARICGRLTKKTSNRFFIPVPYQMSPERKKRMDRFTADHYPEINVTNEKEWKQVIADQIQFVSGSDIIWNPAFGYPSYFFLDFACCADLPCLSYASSIGAPELPKKYHSAYHKYLQHYKGIGVRETSTIGLLSGLTDTPITKVTDPTLLMTASEWDPLADRAELSEKTDEKYVFAYFVMNDERYWKYIEKVRQATGMQIVVIPMHYLDEEQPYTVIMDGTPYEFINLIKNAAFIVTDSFHVCAFSLIYQKDFYLLRRSRKAEDAKYDDFLSRYGLTGRIVTDESRFIPKEQTDYTYAAKKLEEDRSLSMDYLHKTLAARKRH